MFLFLSYCAIFLGRNNCAIFPDSNIPCLVVLTLALKLFTPKRRDLVASIPPLTRKTVFLAGLQEASCCCCCCCPGACARPACGALQQTLQQQHSSPTSYNCTDLLNTARHFYLAKCSQSEQGQLSHVQFVAIVPRPVTTCQLACSSRYTVLLHPSLH